MRCVHSRIWGLGWYALALTSFGQTEKPACLMSGGVFSIDPLANVVLIKRDGLVRDVRFTGSTSFTRIQVGSEGRGQKITADGVHAGDLLCVAAADASGTALAISVVPRAELAAAQRQFVVRWQRNSVYGVVNSIAMDKRSMAVSPALPWDDPAPVGVRLNDTVRYREYTPNATRLTEVTEIRLDEIQVGDYVYIRGLRDPGDPEMQAALIQRGEVRALAGVVLDTNAVQSGILFREYGSNRTLKVRLPSGDVYRTTDSLTNPYRLETRTGMAVVKVDLGDLQPGDTVLVIGKTQRDSEDVLGLGLITNFGSFGKAPDLPDGPITWFLK